ncbi:hypothetical protein ACFVH9_08375 [Streptomyces hirsutus]|uniref:hypothetical protein n=1 Tax=Streptomyces hirsutus TaxID=35620 RepID=UPI00363B7B18
MQANILTTLAGNRIESEAKAREALAGEAADMAQALTPYAIRKAMQAAADAMPWRMLMEDQESESEEQAFLQLRERLTGQLVNAISSSSSCTITNEEDRLKWDGVRRFLRDTEYLVEALNAPQEPATAPEPPKPPTPARRATPTPAQRKAMELIAKGGMRRTQFGMKDPIRISSEHGRIYADTLDVLEREGWAKVDHSTSLFHGQTVNLTDLGASHLPA